MKSPAALIVVPPTVGHVNHGVALGGVVRAAGIRPVLVTGTAAFGYVSGLDLDHPWVCLPSHDLQHLDRNDPRRRPHLEQLCDPHHLRTALHDQRELVGRHHAVMVIGKDYFAAVLAAASCGIPYVSYYTDGIEALLRATSRQTVSDPATLTGQLRMVAAEESISADLAPVPETLRSPVLNIVRGFPRTAAVAPPAWRRYGAAIAFSGALTFDAPGPLLEQWSGRIAEMRRPLFYVTFGTTLGDRRRFADVADAAPLVDGTWLVADPDGDFPAGTSTVLVERYVPNAAALERSTVVVHHGGHGTTLSALVAGVPQLIVPDNPRTQQSTHGQVLQELGVGRVIATRDCSGPAIADGVTALSRRDVRERAVALGAELAVDSAALYEDLARRLAAALPG